MAPPYMVKVLDHSHVAPPPGSLSRTTVPLTFLDVPWLLSGPMQRIFFYEFPYPTLHFIQTILPHLKDSLSLTLRYFFPFAAKLRFPLPPDKPYILYNEGDSVALTFAESDADFNHLVGNHARDARAFQSLVPILPTPRLSSDTEQVTTIMAMQITVFPNSGISIGITFNHVAADGRSFNHFVKSWASIHRPGGEALTSFSPPYHNKDVIKDPGGLFSVYLKDLLNYDYSSPAGSTVPQDNTMITLVLSRARIEKLKEWVTTRIRNNGNELGPIHISTFVVTCAFMWVNLMKLQESETGDQLDDDTPYHFIFVADCRERFQFEVPATYFGNCLLVSFTSAKRSDIMGENGVAVAATAIAERISELEKGPLIGAEQLISKFNEIVKMGRLVTVAGSPKLRVYETDFGWGKPKKTEVTHIGAHGAFSLSECRDEVGGVEIGLVLGRQKLDLYNEFFEQWLILNVH